jgi:hypothetical protein
LSFCQGSLVRSQFEGDHSPDSANKGHYRATEKLLANRATRANPIKNNQAVAKKIKITQTDVTGDPTSATSGAKTDKVKPRGSTAGKTKKPIAKKAARNQKTKSTKSMEPTDEEIRLRAYFISERRRRFALPGDASSDWLEARRQLLSETGRR